MNLRRGGTRLSMVGVALVLAILGVFLFDIRADEDQTLEAGDTSPGLQSDAQTTSTTVAIVAANDGTQATGLGSEDQAGAVDQNAPGGDTDATAASDSAAGTPSSTPETQPTTSAIADSVAPVAPSPSGGKPVIHLTFDDGPSELTPRVMDLLERYNARGTFFVMGQAVEQHPDIARQIVERGHAIANHSYDHMDWRQAGAREDIIKTQSIIEAETGVTPSCARPPFGADSPELIATLQSLGMASWRWDLATEDHDERKFLVEQTLNTIPEVLKIWGSEGKIVLQHDSDLLLSPSIDGLEAWLAKNADKYEFKVIDNCLNYQ